MSTSSKPGIPERDPWFHASKEERKYLTPEDIGSAIEAGAEKVFLFEIVLRALGWKRCEDWSLCVFVAQQGPKGGWKGNVDT